MPKVKSLHYLVLFCLALILILVYAYHGWVAQVIVALKSMDDNQKVYVGETEVVDVSLPWYIYAHDSWSVKLGRIPPFGYNCHVTGKIHNYSDLDSMLSKIDTMMSKMKDPSLVWSKELYNKHDTSIYYTMFDEHIGKKVIHYEIKRHRKLGIFLVSFCSIDFLDLKAELNSFLP